MLQTIGTAEQLKRHCDGIDTLMMAVECVSFSMEFPPRDKIRARQDRIFWIRDGIIDRIEKRADLALNVGTVGEAPHSNQ